MRFNERVFLIKTIKELRRRGMSYMQILIELKKMRILPDKWHKEKKVRQYFSKYKDLVAIGEPQINPSIEIFDFIKPVIKNMEISDKTRFDIYFKQLSGMGKTQFFDWLAVPYIQKGTPMMEICTVMSNDFRKIGLLNKVTITKYIPNKFKNLEKQAHKLGKHIKKSGSNHKGAI